MPVFYMGGPMFFGFEPEQNPQDKKSCPVCGTTLEDIRKTSVVGCTDCYEAFKDELFPWIEKVQAEPKHMGKIGVSVPVKSRQEQQIFSLRRDLQKAIDEERYEEAAILRDRIAEYDIGE